MLWTAQAGAQAPGGPTGTVSGSVVDSASQQPLSDVSVRIVGTQRGVLTRNDGSYTITGVPVGAQTVRFTRIGYGSQTRAVTVNAGATATVGPVALNAQAAVLSEVVTVGYGTQRREAITGAVANVKAEEANVGVIPNANAMLTARVAGVNVVQNNGEPGAGAQIRVRGGTSISASNEPLYVIDGVPLQNNSTEPGGIGVGGGAALARSPLNSLNPNDISSITVLKDASATAIYGSRGANGVILIETKRGTNTSAIEYDAYVAGAAPSRKLDFLTGEEYRSFIQQQVSAGVLTQERLQGLGTANTDWEDELTRLGVSQNHNVAFYGGSSATTYRASLNYFDQRGVVISSGFQRYQGRLNAQHQAFGGKLQLGLNLTTSRVLNDYLPFENTGGFEGGVFVNTAIFNPTRPVQVTDPNTGTTTFYEIGAGSQSVRNPVALARQLDDNGRTDRTLGNVTASYALLPSVTARVTTGVDRSNALRRTFFPRANPVGAATNGRARQVELDLQNLNFQGLLTWAPRFENHELDVIGGYEYSDFDNSEFGADVRGFSTDAFGFNNLAGGNKTASDLPFSSREESRLVSFFTRANYGWKNRYFLTGVLRYDGSSRLAEGNKWSTFPAVSASWRMSDESFFPTGGWLSTLALRAGWGLQGNQAVLPYATQVLLTANTGASYPFGGVVRTGVVATRNENPDLKWETSEQLNVGLDYGVWNNRVTGVLDFYVKNTRDLLLEVAVPQPAFVANRFENIGRVRNTGFEATLDAQLVNQQNRSLTSGLILSVERNEVVDLGGDRQFIVTGTVSGQGQSGQNSQRIIPGQPLGTFFGPEYVGVDGAGKQLFNKYTVTRDAQGRETGRTLNGTTTTPSGDDMTVIGDANPAFALGVRSNATWGRLDASWLWRGEFGRDVFNNTALVYGTKGNALQEKNFLRDALTDPIGLREPAIYSSRWIEDGSFVRLQNVTVGYRLDRLPGALRTLRSTRVYLSGDNLLLFTSYSGYDPEVFVDAGLATRGIDYLVYPRARTFTLGANVQF